MPSAPPPTATQNRPCTMDSDESPANRGWQQLPEQLVAHLLRSLDGVGFRRARLVCRLWADAGAEALQAASLVGGRDSALSVAPKLASLGALRALTVTGPCDLTDLAEGLRGLQRLSSVNLIDCDVGDSWVSAALPPSVTRLAVSQSAEVTSADLRSIPTALPGLVDLSLSGCQGITGVVMKYITQLTNLRSLKLQHCDNVSKTAVASALVHLQGLTSLDLSRSKQIAGTVMSKISGMTTLTHLCLEGCSRVASRHLSCLRPLVRLLSLNLSSCPGVSDRGLEELGELLALLDLRIEHCDRVTDEGLSELAHLTALKTLHLSCWNKGVTNAGLSSVAKLSRLQTLSLQNCSKEVTADGIRALSNLTNLSSLGLTTCYLYTDTGIDLLSDLAGLTRLDLSWCSNISDDQLQLLLKLSNLQELILACCLGVDDSVMESIAHLPELSLLDVSYCTQVSDEGLAALHRLTCLTQLSVSCNTGVSDCGLRSLGALTRLQSLRLVDACPDVTVKGIASLWALSSLSRLELLSFSELTDGDLRACLEIPSLETLALFNCPQVTQHGRAALQPRIWVWELKL